MEAVERFPARSYRELVNSYTELVFNYLEYSCEVHYGPSYKAKKKEMENTIVQIGNMIRCKRNQNLETGHYFISFNKTVYRLDLGKTMYIHSEGRKVIFVQDTGETFETYTRLENIWDDLQSIICFRRISKSYIVNFFYVDSQSGSNIRIGDQIFNISRKYFHRGPEQGIVLPYVLYR